MAEYPDQHEFCLFGRFSVDLTCRTLLKDGVAIEIEPKVFQALELLLHNPGHVFTYDQFNAVLWTDVVVEVKQNVNTQINKLRRALSESGQTPVYILTKHGKGYYFSPDVPVRRQMGPRVPESQSTVHAPSVKAADPEQAESEVVSERAIGRSILYGLAGATALVGIAIYMLLVPHGPLADYFVQGRNLIVVNGKGRELWRHSFPSPLIESAYREELRLRLAWLGDLDGDGRQALLFLAIPVNRGDVGTELVCFGADGKIRWQFIPGRAVADGDGNRIVPPYFAASLQVFLGKSPQNTRIVVSSAHYVTHADQVAFLDIHGRAVGEYWHPGHLLHVDQMDLEGLGHNELLLGGVNNGNHQATLVVLDPWRITEIQTPADMRDQRFRLLGMSPAREQAVLFFPRSCISIGQPYTRVGDLHVTKERIVVEVAEGPSEDGAGFVYELDHGLHVVSVVPGGIGVARLHEELEAQGKLHHPFDTEKECERLKSGVIVRRSDLALQQHTQLSTTQR